MSELSRVSLKSLFENNDIPDGTDYSDLIDSFVNLVDSSTQTMASKLSLPNISVTSTVSAATLSLSGAATISGALTVSGQFTSSAASFVDSTHTGVAQYSIGTGYVANALTAVSASTMGVEQISVITTAATSASGTRLISPRAGLIQKIVYSGDVTACLVFPASGASLNGGSSSYRILKNSAIDVIHTSSTAYFVVSS